MSMDKKGYIICKGKCSKRYLRRAIRQHLLGQVGTVCKSEQSHKVRAVEWLKHLSNLYTTIWTRLASVQNQRKHPQESYRKGLPQNRRTEDYEKYLQSNAKWKRVMRKDFTCFDLQNYNRERKKQQTNPNNSNIFEE
eukprot:2132348-Amphidinium_carterae.1